MKKEGRLLRPVGKASSQFGEPAGKSPALGVVEIPALYGHAGELAVDANRHAFALGRSAVGLGESAVGVAGEAVDHSIYLLLFRVVFPLDDIIIHQVAAFVNRFLKKKEEDFSIFFKGLFQIPDRRCNQVGQQDAPSAPEHVGEECLHGVAALAEEGNKQADDVEHHVTEEVAVEADSSDTEHFVYLLCSFDGISITHLGLNVNTYFLNN